MTYKDYLDAENTPLFNTKDVGRSDGDLKHQCTCGGWEFAKFMLDIRAFDIGDDFACGGCISSWERNLIPIMIGDDFLTRHEWRAKFTERRNGTKDAGAEMVKSLYLEREIKKAIAAEILYIKTSNKNPNKIKAIAYRTALESRRI